MHSPIRISARTVREARTQAQSQLAPGLAITDETIEVPGKVTRLRATARTTEAALEKARQAVPDGAEVVAEEVVTASERQVVEIEAPSKALAQRQLERKLQKLQVLEELEVKAPPRRLMGIVREPGKYEATILQAAVVELTYRTDFVVSFGIGPKASYESVRLWGGFGPQAGKFYYPVAMTVDLHGRIYVTDNGFHLDENGKFTGHMSRVQRFDSEGNWLDTVGEHVESGGQLLSAQGVATDGQGRIYVADGQAACIVQFSAEGQELARWGSKGDGSGQFSGRALRLAVSGEGLLYVSDQGHHRVSKFDLQGTFLTSFGGRGSEDGQLERPEGLAVDGQGCLYVADGGNNRLQKFDGQGQHLATWGTRGDEPGQFRVPRGVAVDPMDYVYVCGADTRVQKFDSQGHFIGQWGSEGKDPGQLNRPVDLAVDPLGRVYVLEHNNSRVQVFA